MVKIHAEMLVCYYVECLLVFPVCLYSYVLGILFYSILVYRFFLYFLHVFMFTCVSLHIYRSGNFQWHILRFKLHPSHLLNPSYYN